MYVSGCGGERDRGKRPLMGEVATRLSDEVIITSDNPRRENPDAIIGEIASGTTARFHIEKDRAAGSNRPSLARAEAISYFRKRARSYQEVDRTKIAFRRSSGRPTGSGRTVGGKRMMTVQAQPVRCRQSGWARTNGLTGTVQITAL